MAIARAIDGPMKPDVIYPVSGAHEAIDTPLLIAGNLQGQVGHTVLLQLGQYIGHEPEDPGLPVDGADKHDVVVDQFIQDISIGIRYRIALGDYGRRQEKWGHKHKDQASAKMFLHDGATKFELNAPSVLSA
jgi:hypothetical protein